MGAPTKKEDHDFSHPKFLQEHRQRKKKIEETIDALGSAKKELFLLDCAYLMTPPHAKQAFLARHPQYALVLEARRADEEEEEARRAEEEEEDLYS